MMQQNTKSLLFFSLIVVSMFGLSFAAVPLYDLFCRVTGFGGTPQITTSLPEVIGSSPYTVAFNTDVAKDLTLQFKPIQRKIEVIPGKHNLIFYQAKNIGNKPVTGIASFNVVPEKVGQYFSKIECFCFTDQLFAPGQIIDLPVSFYLDPKIEEDPNMQDVNHITLSYTFFNSKTF